MPINWDCPRERAQLLERVGPAEYGRQIKQHFDASTVATVNGHAIRHVSTRFGRLFSGGSTGQAFQPLEQAQKYARGPAGATWFELSASAPAGTRVVFVTSWDIFP